MRPGLKNAMPTLHKSLNSGKCLKYTKVPNLIEVLFLHEKVREAKNSDLPLKQLSK